MPEVLEPAAPALPGRELANEALPNAAPPSRDRQGAVFELRDLGRVSYAEAFALQQDFVDRRKRGEIPDQLLILEHPHVITMGRNGRDENLLAAPEVLARAGIDFQHTDRGGDG